MVRCMKKRLVESLIIICVLAFSGIVNLYCADEVHAMGKRLPASSTPVLLGAILPLTGNSAFLGQDENKILTLLQKTYQPNGRSLEIKIEDNKSSQKDAVAAYHKLRNEGVGNFILSLTRSVEAIAPMGTADNAIMMGMSMAPQIAKRSDLLFRMYYGTEAQLDKMVDYMSERNLKSLAILYIETPEMSSTYFDVLPEMIKSRGLDLTIVAAEPFDFSGKEIKSAMAKIADKKPDIVIAEDYGALYPQILETAKTYGIADNLIGGIGFRRHPSRSNQNCLKASPLFFRKR